MKIKLNFLVVLVLIFSSCNDKGENGQIINENKVLILKVDYLTKNFEGGKELSFSKVTPTFTIETAYKAPGDFGNIKLTYKELNETLFDGDIIWMGKGEINYPKNFLNANQFLITPNKDKVYPNAGFKNLLDFNNLDDDFQTVWNSVQNVLKVRQYLLNNPNAKVQYFLYTPSVGVGNPADWDWIIFLKN